MSEQFDAYRKWLGIPPEEQPPHHYRLLGLGLFESDDDVIQEAADRQMAHVQRHKLGPYGPLSQQLLNELSAARHCLLSSEKKAAYDEQLRSRGFAKALPAEQPADPQSAPLILSPPGLPANAVNGPGVPHPARPLAGSFKGTDLADRRSAGRKRLIYLAVGGALLTLPLVVTGLRLWGSHDDGPPEVANLRDQTSTFSTDAASFEDSEAADTGSSSVDTRPTPEPPAAQEAQSDRDDATTGQIGQRLPDETPTGNSESSDIASNDDPRNDTPSPRLAADRPRSLLLSAHGAPIRGVAVRPDGRQAVSVSHVGADGQPSLCVWDLRRQKRRDVSVLPLAFNAATYSSDGQQLFTAAQNQRISVWHVGSDDAPQNFSGLAQSVSCLALSADGRFLAAGGRDGLAVWEMPQPDKPVFRWRHPSGQRVTCLALSADGSRLWAGCGGAFTDDKPTGGADHKLYQWDLTSGSTLQSEQHAGGIWGLALAPDGTRVATASDDHTLRLWEAKTLEVLHELRGHRGPVYAVAFARSGRCLASASADQTVRIWNPDTALEMQVLEGSEGSLYAVTVSDDCKMVVAGGEDRSVHVWEFSAPGAQGESPTAQAQVPSAEASEPSAEKPEPAAVIALRMPLPAESQTRTALALVRETFDEEFKQARKGPEKQLLAEKLLRQSEDSRDPAERYALLLEARTLAADAGRPSLLIGVIEATGTRFDIDVPQTVAEVLEPIAGGALPVAARKEMAEKLPLVADRAVSEDHFELARRLLAMARKVSDAAFVKQITARLAEVAEAQKAFEVYQRSAAVLKENPDDPAANLTVGKYLALVKQDWSAAPRYLLKGDDETLRPVAELELAAPDETIAQLKLGDLWWGLVENSKGKDKADYAARCAHWYALVLPNLDGLSETKVSRRLEELSALGKSKTPAVSTGERGPSKALIQRVKLALRKDALARTELVGRPGGTPFLELPQQGCIVGGFNYALDDTARRITAIQPIYLTARGPVTGTLVGVAGGPIKSVVAKKGYAVSGLRVQASTFVYGMEVSFSKLAETGFDTADKYTSDWIGYSVNANRKMLGDNGQPVVGLCGNMFNADLIALGLVQLVK